MCRPLPEQRQAHLVWQTALRSPHGAETTGPTASLSQLLLEEQKGQDDTGHASWTGTCPDRSGRGDLLSAVTTEGLPKNEEAFAFLPHVK